MTGREGGTGGEGGTGREPALLVAWLVLAVTGLIATILTVVDRTPDTGRPVAVPVGEAAAPTVPSGPASFPPGAAPPPSKVPPAPSSTASEAATSQAPGSEAPAPGATGPGDAGRPTAGATAAIACPPSGIVLRASEVSGAMGLRAMGVELTNCGTQPYALSGYPVVQVLGADRTPLAVEVIRGPSDITSLPSVDDPPEDMVLQQGESAGATLVWRASMLDSAGGGAHLQVAPQGGRPAETVPLPDELDLGNDGRMGTGPWIFRSPGSRS